MIVRTSLLLCSLPCLLLPWSILGGPLVTTAEAQPSTGEPAAAAADEPPAAIPLGSPGKLPWAKSNADRPKPPIRRLAGPRELLDMFGIDESQLNAFFDEQPLGPDDDETLFRVLFRLPQFDLDDIERWETKGVTWEDVVAEPAQYRAQFFRLSGRVHRVEQQPLLPEVVKLFEFDHYYRLTMQLDDAPYPVVVCTRVIPQAWQVGADIDERATALGMFLKVGDVSGERPQLVFAARRMGWLPDRVDPQRGVLPAHVALADLGMDIGLFDDVRTRNRKGMGGADRECFYQLLMATRQADLEKIGDTESGAFELGPLLQDPSAQHGQLMDVICTVRQVTKVMVSEPDIQERFGIDHYYQLDAFLPLGDRVVRLGQSAEDTEGPVYTNNYPATFCVLRLPPALQTLADQIADGTIEGETLNERVRMKGFFFKLWAYKSQYVSAFDERQLQLAPMFIAAAPEMAPITFSSNPLLGLLAGLTFVLALGAVWYGLWRYNRSDEQFERTTLSRQFEVEKGKSLNEMGIESQDEPDFSGLD